MIKSNALHYMLLFQNEMKGLLGVFSRMRSEVSTMSEFANVVRTVIDTDKCVSAVNTSAPYNKIGGSDVHTMRLFKI